ncbi:hypothetical protein UFOVP317_16 [uncultured Caudovirales phage]|uniref:DUF7936 domain-containing protein n=1 Tax=uncultured Caudovirales phage TaxID=2100421 RepID=A0A6J5LW46_9CAUD|nr:hypothetical protein UFOVP317_16 [uncultured Caudovirales phage]
MITYKWAVTQMDAYPDFAGNADVVFTVHWRMDGVDGEHGAGVCGAAMLALDPKADFMPYEKLTEDQVIGWVKDALGKEQVAAYEELVAKQIDAIVNPPVVSPPLPWGA